MWNWLAKRRLQRLEPKRAQIDRGDIERTRSVLFAVFARYGDSIIAYKVICEFTRSYPDKSYTLVTTPQSLPYAQEILPAETEYYGVNKRKSVVDVTRLFWRLHRSPPDVGFNPWSHGKESEYVISFATRFRKYSEFAIFARKVNLYDRVRQYMLLPDGSRAESPRLSSVARRILISPFSIDIRKSLDSDDLEILMGKLEARYPGARFTIAQFASEAARSRRIVGDRIFFAKNRRTSMAFLRLLKSVDLFVCRCRRRPHASSRCAGHSGRRNIWANCPQTTLDRDSTLVPLRIDVMRGWFCDVRACAVPVCLHRLVADQLNFEPIEVHSDTIIKKEGHVCRAAS